MEKFWRIEISVLRFLRYSASAGIEDLGQAGAQRTKGIFVNYVTSRRGPCLRTVKDYAIAPRGDYGRASRGKRDEVQ
jgi:hypothetical protein